MSANTLSLGGSKRSPLSAPRSTSATAQTSGSAPESPGADESADSGALTTSRLYRFGGIIAIAIIAVVSVAMWGSSNQSSALEERNKIAATRDFVFQADMLHDAIRATVFGSALTSQTGQPDVDALQAELKESVPQFTDNIQGAIDLNDDPQIVADLRGILPEVAAYGDASLKLSLAWADLESTDAGVRTAGKADYTQWLATFNSLKDKMAAAEDAIDLKSKAVLADADSSGTTSETIVIIGALIALGVFAFVWRKVLRATARMNVLQGEMVRLGQEAEESREREKKQEAEALERDRQQQERERTEAADVLAKEQTAAAELQGRVDQLLVALAGAAAGDLTVDVPVSSDDAVGQMGVALRKLLSDLRVSVSSIASNSEALAAAAEEFQVVSEQMGSNSAETSNQVNLVTQATSEVSRNVEILSTGAEQMSASIKEIAKNASDAAKVTGQAVEAAQSTNETVAKLGESSAEIGQIVKVITGIAQQTNLLALNATIEAARAGEAGKGFAVVANEVKELAKETALATEDISQKITAIQLDTGRSVDAIAGILMIINQIAEYQDTIASAVEEQAATTSEMARSVNDASRGSTEITANMQNVRDAANSTASGASDSQRAATELARMSSDLQALVAQFNY
ncbi:MAG: methyl-accepting chemotaxis sensory transducer with Pas/Pac sensor [Acidimicrobiales bacterium]|nr:methyl-accepting chemotaxis sensory transducer with Pas/Pac sensor [Acidimicrobiales bacterium]